MHKSIIFFAACFVGACGSSSSSTGPTTDDSGAGDETISGDDSSTTIDAPGGDTITTTDAPGTDTFVPPVDAGPVRRLPCVGTSGLANNLPFDAYGAIEGELVSIVPPGTHGCPNDSDHLHLQIDVDGKRYDIAMTINDTTGGQPMDFLTKDIAPKPLPKGWNAVGFDFPTDLGVHSGDFTAMAKAPLLARLQSELATVSFVTIHGKSYTDGTGVHDVHRNGGGHDGVLLAHGVGAGGLDHALALHFYNDTF